MYCAEDGEGEHDTVDEDVARGAVGNAEDDVKAIGYEPQQPGVDILANEEERGGDVHGRAGTVDERVVGDMAVNEEDNGSKCGYSQQRPQWVRPADGALVLLGRTFPRAEADDGHDGTVGVVYTAHYQSVVSKKIGHYAATE